MISAPQVMIQCDARTANGAPCRTAKVLTLPAWESSRVNALVLFMRLNQGWRVGLQSGRIFCPDCAAELRRAQAKARETAP